MAKYNHANNAGLVIWHFYVTLWRENVTLSTKPDVITQAYRIVDREV